MFETFLWGLKSCPIFSYCTLIKMKPVNIRIKRNYQIVFRRITNYLEVHNDFELDLINFFEDWSEDSQSLRVKLWKLTDFLTGSARRQRSEFLVWDAVSARFTSRWLNSKETWLSYNYSGFCWVSVQWDIFFERICRCHWLCCNIGRERQMPPALKMYCTELLREWLFKFFLRGKNGYFSNFIFSYQPIKMW